MKNSPTIVKLSQKIVKKTPTMIHFGKKIKQLVREQNLNPEKFAESIGLKHRSLYDLYRRQNISTALLPKISAALNHDMFQYLYAGGNSPAEKLLNEKITQLQLENTQLKKENALLQEIVRLKK